jgi:hypothetical protein
MHADLGVVVYSQDILGFLNLNSVFLTLCFEVSQSIFLSAVRRNADYQSQLDSKPAKRSRGSRTLKND